MTPDDFRIRMRATVTKMVMDAKLDSLVSCSDLAIKVADYASGVFDEMHQAVLDTVQEERDAIARREQYLVKEKALNTDWRRELADKEAELRERGDYIDDLVEARVGDLHWQIQELEEDIDRERAFTRDLTQQLKAWRDHYGKNFPDGDFTINIPNSSSTVSNW